MKSIGEKIKEYRQKNQMTQEQLASCMNITFQTVSKWETGVSNPDLALIVPLTKLFHISADELLGVNDEEADKRYEEFRQAYDHTYKTEDFVERQRLCELAVAEYPGDMYWLCNLAWVISNRSFEYEDNDRYVAEQEKAIRLFDAVVKNCRDEELRGYAIQGITQLLGWRGRRDEAKKYAEMLPEKTAISREAVWENVLEGDELLQFKQKRIMSHLKGILWDLSLMPAQYTDLIRSLVLLMFPDGNLLEFNHTLYYALQREINTLCRERPEGAEEKILVLLNEMKGYAEAYDRVVFHRPGMYSYTSPWFDHIREDTKEWLGNEGESMTADFRDYLEKEQFDFMRNLAGYAQQIG